MSRTIREECAVPQAEDVSTRPPPNNPVRSLSLQAVSLAAATMVAQGLTAVMYVVVARHADPRVFGVLVAAISVGLAGVGLVDFGGNAFWIRELASGRIQAQDLGLRVLVKLATAGLLGLVWLSLTRFVEGSWLPGIAAPILFTTLVSQTISIFPRAASRSDLAAVAVFVDRSTACLLMLVLLVAAGVSPVVSLWVGLSAGALAGAGTAWVLSPVAFRPRLQRDQSLNPWHGTAAFGVSSLANSGQSFDVALLAATGGSAAAGLYGAVSRWTQPMGLVVNAFSQASAPVIAGAPSWEDAWWRVRKGLWLPLLAIAGCLGVALGSPLLVPLILGRGYAGSSVVLTILALGTIPAILNQPLSVFLQARGHPRPVSALFVVSVAAQLLLVALLADRFGARAGALGLALGQSVQLAGLLMLVRRVAPSRAGGWLR